MIEKTSVIMDLYSLTDGTVIKRIGEKIRQLRLERNISQKDLADSAGVSLSSVASLEKGRSVSLATFLPMLRALDAFQLLSSFISEPEISPIAYAKMMEGQKQRKRASALKQKEQTEVPEW